MPHFISFVTSNDVNYCEPAALRDDTLMGAIISDDVVPTKGRNVQAARVEAVEGVGISNPQTLA